MAGAGAWPCARASGTCVRPASVAIRISRRTVSLHYQRLNVNVTRRTWFQPPEHPVGLTNTDRRMAPDGAPGRTRTSNPQIRSLVLYPIELRAQREAGT